MRMPRLRFTVRRMMVVVAIVGTALGSLAVSRSRALGLTRYHREHSGRWVDRFRRTGDWRHDAAMALWHARLEEQYERAARYPWLPVAPEPPEPE